MEEVELSKMMSEMEQREMTTKMRERASAEVVQARKCCERKMRPETLESGRIRVHRPTS